MLPEAGSPPFLEVRGVTKAFGPRMVLKGIDLSLRKGDFLSIFGPNGAGKTTLIKILATVSNPGSGSMTLDGLDARRNAVEVRRRIGVVSHDNMLYGSLTAYENLTFYGRMYDVDRLDERAASLIERVGLSAAMHQRVTTYSHGMLKRLSIARAFIHDPPFLLLDEPETGLDQQGIQMLADTLQSLGTEGRTVIMTTHSLERGLRACNRVAILSRGRIVYHEATQETDPCKFTDTYRQHTEVGR